MKTIQHFFSSELIEALGWTLVHSFWQGALLACLLMLLLIIMRRNSAQVKYFISYVALLGLLVWSAATFVHSYNYAIKKAALKENIISTPGYIKSFLEQSTTGDSLEKINDKGSLNLQIVRLRSVFQRNFYIVCTFWMIGILFLVLRMIGGFMYLRRIRSVNLIIIDKEWMNKLEELSGKLQIKRKIEAFFSPLVKTPLTIGFLKPVILFPVSVFTGFSTKEIEAILAHELAHVLRHDYFFNILQSIMEILFFFNPAAWIISAQIHRERENSCDNIAIGLTEDRISYAKALAAVQASQVEQGHLAMAFASSNGNILYRIKRLQNKVTMKTNFCEGLIASGAIVIGLILVSFTFGNTLPPNVKSGYQNTQVDKHLETNNNAVEKKRTSAEVDSILFVTRQKIQKNEALGQSSEKTNELIEVALSEPDEDLSAEMLDNINKAMEEINIDQIVREAMDEASKAVQEAYEEIDYKEIERDLREAARDVDDAKTEVEKEIRHEIRNADGLEKESLELGLAAAKMGLSVASTVLESLPLDEIISVSLKGAEAALKNIGEIDFDSACEKGKISEKDKKQMKEQMKYKEKEMKRQLEELESHMEQLDKQK
jgi:bla regulator protein BlaR1